MSPPRTATFLSRIQSVYAHVDSAPYVASFLHTQEGSPTEGIIADCLWYPPDIPSELNPWPSEGEEEAEDEDAEYEQIDSPVEPHETSMNAGAGRQEPSTHTTDAQDYFPPFSAGSDGIIRDEDSEPGVSVFLFIPGNPGIVSFYQEFLNTIRKAHPSLGILAHSHIGHAPRLSSLPGKHGNISRSSASLTVQVQSAIEAYDAIKAEYRDVGGCKVILCGHSIGCWVALQVLKARPYGPHATFLLFPTICDMAKTPNGRKLRLLFTFVSAYILTGLSFLLFSLLLPARMITSLLAALFPHWPRHQIFVLRSLLRSPRTVFSALRMGRDEMAVVKDLTVTVPSSKAKLAEKSVLGKETTWKKDGSEDTDVAGGVAEVLDREAKRIWVYYGDQDMWVPEGSADEVYEILKGGGGAVEPEERTSFSTDGEVVFGAGVTHDFCINHEVEIGQLCSKWLEKGLLVPQ